MSNSIVGSHLVKRIDELMANAYRIDRVDSDYQENFANEGIRKAAYIVDDLKYRESDGLAHPGRLGYLCLGGADGLEVEYILSETAISMADDEPTTLKGFAMKLRAILSIPLGFVVIFLLGSIASDVIKHIYVNHSDITYVVLQLASDCFSCAIGGALTAAVGRSQGASLIVGLLFAALVVIAGFRIKTTYPAWYAITLAILVIPSVVAGSTVTKKRAAAS